MGIASGTVLGVAECVRPASGVEWRGYVRVADRQEGPAVSVHCEELYCMYSGRGTCVQFGVAVRQEGPAVSVGLWVDLWCVRFLECYGAIAVYDRIILEYVMKWNGDL